MMRTEAAVPGGNPHRYDDIIARPHPVSAQRIPMARQKRAAQFAPFAALTGYDEVVRESARRTVCRPELEEDAQQALDLRLRLLAEYAHREPTVRVVYFAADARKSGGECRTVQGILERIDPSRRLLLLRTGECVPLNDILSIDSPFFRIWELPD